MKKLLLASAVAIAVFTGCGNDPAKWGDSTLRQATITNAGANNAYLVVKNNTGSTITSGSIYISQTSSATWGSSVYSSSLADKASTSEKSIDAGSVSGCTKNVDLRVDLPDGNKTVKYDQTLNCGATYEWTIN